jgi:hypothetical protein
MVAGVKTVLDSAALAEPKQWKIGHKINILDNKNIYFFLCLTNFKISRKIKGKTINKRLPFNFCNYRQGRSCDCSPWESEILDTPLLRPLSPTLSPCPSLSICLFLLLNFCLRSSF